MIIRAASILLAFSILFPSQCLLAADTHQSTAVSQALEKISISLTTNDQTKFGGVDVIGWDQKTHAAQFRPKPGTPMALPDGNVYLLVELDLLPLPGVSATGGKDMYLVDGKRMQHTGYSWMMNGWIDATNVQSIKFEQRMTKMYMYVLPADNVTGSVFHFLGVDYDTARYLDTEDPNTWSSDDDSHSLSLKRLLYGVYPKGAASSQAFQSVTVPVSETRDHLSNCLILILKENGKPPSLSKDCHLLDSHGQKYMLRGCMYTSLAQAGPRIVKLLPVSDMAVVPPMGSANAVDSATVLAFELPSSSGSFTIVGLDGYSRAQFVLPDQSPQTGNRASRPEGM